MQVKVGDFFDSCIFLGEKVNLQGESAFLLAMVRSLLSVGIDLLSFAHDLLSIIRDLLSVIRDLLSVIIYLLSVVNITPFSALHIAPRSNNGELIFFSRTKSKNVSRAFVL